MNFARRLQYPIFLFRTSSELVALSGTIGRQLAELLRHYNCRCCQLVLGAGAMEVAGLKTITSTILVLAARSLKLILWFMPFVKAHFQGNSISRLRFDVLHSLQILRTVILEFSVVKDKIDETDAT